MEIKVKIKENITKDFPQFQKQLPFVTASALTKTAKDMQSGLTEYTKERYTIRKPWLDKSKYAIRVTPATKQTLKASVWNDAPWMQGQEQAEERTPEGKAFAIPTDNVKRNKKDLITQSNKPRNLRRSFLITTKDGIGIILKRSGKRVVKVMYILAKKAKLIKEWGFEKEGRKLFDKTYQKNFDDALNKAISTINK